MTVLAVTITDPVFDKKSSEVAYLARVLEQVALKLRNQQGAVAASQNVLGQRYDGLANQILASYTYTASGSTV